MKRFLEDMGAAAGLAQAGDQNEAQAIIEELRRLRESAGARILLVAEASALPGRVARYVSSLASRLGSNLLVVLPESAIRGDGPPAQVDSLQKAGEDIEVTGFFSSGDCLELARDICDQIRGVELILVHAPGTENKTLCLHRQFKVPVYRIG